MGSQSGVSGLKLVVKRTFVDVEMEEAQPLCRPRAMTDAILCCVDSKFTDDVCNGFKFMDAESDRTTEAGTPSDDEETSDTDDEPVPVLSRPPGCLAGPPGQWAKPASPLVSGPPGTWAQPVFAMLVSWGPEDSAEWASSGAGSDSEDQEDDESSPCSSIDFACMTPTAKKTHTLRWADVN